MNSFLKLPTISQTVLLLIVGLLLGTLPTGCKKTTDPALPKSSDNSITAFAFNGLSPAINATISGNTISATVPVGTNLTALVPTIVLPAGASVSPASGVAQNFSSPVTYTVKAEDGTIQTYTVSVSIQGISIVSFAPTSGGAGTTVVINGAGFSNVSTDNKVTINGLNAPITASRADQITVQIPERAGSGNLVVAVGGKQATSASAFSYQYQVGTNTTLYSASGRAFQSTAVDPDDGTVYASDRTNSAVITIKTNGTTSVVTLNDPSGVKHASLTGINILKTGLGGSTDKYLIVTNEAKGIYAYTLSTLAYWTPVQANDAIYNAPTSVAVVSQSASASFPTNGIYYMACFGNSTIVRTNRSNGMVSGASTVGAAGSRGFNAGQVSSTNARFNGVVGIFLKNNLLYVADEGNHAVRVIDYNAGTVNTLFGNGTAGNADGNASAVRLNLPANVVVDNSGLVYVTDRGNGKIRVFDPRSQTSQTLISGLNAPYGLSIDNSGALYVGEWGAGTNRILKLTVK
ncbi:IPT/TIG domain-containing protein [Fibrella forsythiae]|uniref:IPT/TIG domain-containing protein n=1 Tax=Fibrella forsythiae TaxID=2817061 RepID=A0ABS3JG16_9BACT|nr:IPT/TIG domain-containing protein [Fibrella forsythiae]MBO0948942.1 IPT/TIG domain-containing protein [Fibrella forsythiae]